MRRGRMRKMYRETARKCEGPMSTYDGQTFAESHLLELSNTRIHEQIICRVKGRTMPWGSPSSSEMFSKVSLSSKESYDGVNGTSASA